MEELGQAQLTRRSWHSDPGPASQLLSLETTLDLRQRSCLIDIDRQLHGQWGLGKNFVLAWSPRGAIFLATIARIVSVFFLSGRMSPGSVFLFGVVLPPTILSQVPAGT